MKEDKRQYQLKSELEYRLNWYWQIRDKTAKQLLFAPKSTKGVMSDLIFVIDNKALPVVRKLLETIGQWSREDAQEFYDTETYSNNIIYVGFEMRGSFSQ